LQEENPLLFDRFSILDILPHQERTLRQRINSLPPNAILAASEEDLVQSLKDEFYLDTPVLDENKIEIDYGEQQIDARTDPTPRFLLDRSQPFYIAGTKVTFAIPFCGDASLLALRPQNFTYTPGGPHGEVVGNEIQVTFAGINLNGERVRREFDNELRFIKQNLESLRTAIDRHNESQEKLIRTQIQQRKQKLLSDSAMVNSLGFPIKRRDGAPTTYAVPVRKRKPRIEEITARSDAFRPEPALAESEYKEILKIIQNMVQVMEQSPHAFEQMGEEGLRTHFLVQLNGQYEGTATGETFNFQGKTDILIKVEGKNVFIAECKFWDGEKQFLGTIDQLLSYLSWRDTKTAVVIFNRNQNFTEVLRKIAEITPTHSLYKRTLPQNAESGFRYIFGQPNDANREVILTVMVFDIPKTSKTAKSTRAI
jgi:hypothetical protein